VYLRPNTYDFDDGREYPEDESEPSGDYDCLINIAYGSSLDLSPITLNGYYVIHDASNE